jgi:hypothetical protein
MPETPPQPQASIQPQPTQPGAPTQKNPEAAREGRIARSWRLTRSAWRVVRYDRAILMLALLSTLLGAAAIVVIFGFTGLVTSGGAGHRHLSSGRLALAALILAYPLVFISVFFNTAIAAAASAALDDRRMTLREALAVPARRLGQVAVWALLATVFGVVLEQIARRLPLAGAIAARLIGAAWSLASLFAIPVLAIEGCSAPQSLRRSTQLVKQRWGEGIGGNLIVTAWTVIVFVPAVVLFVVLMAASSGDSAARIAIVVVAIAAAVALFAVSSVVRQIFAVALYRYAKDHDSHGPFSAHDLQSPFRRRRRLFG